MDQAITLLTAAHDSATQLAIIAGPDIPDPGNGSAPPGVGGAFEDVMGWVKWICLGICVLMLVVLGARMAISGSRRGEGGELMGGLGWVMLGVCIIAGAVSIVGFLVTASAEEEAAGPLSETTVVAMEQVSTDG